MVTIVSSKDGGKRIQRGKDYRQWEQVMRPDTENNIEILQ